MRVRAQQEIIKHVHVRFRANKHLCTASEKISFVPASVLLLSSAARERVDAAYAAAVFFAVIFSRDRTRLEGLLSFFFLIVFGVVFGAGLVVLDRLGVSFCYKQTRRVE